MGKLSWIGLWLVFLLMFGILFGCSSGSKEEPRNNAKQDQIIKKVYSW